MNRPVKTQLSLGTMHAGQVAAYWALKPYRFKALRCGRRFGKTDFGKIWIAQGLAQGDECAWFAPQHKTWSEVYPEIANTVRPILDTSSKGSAVMRMKNRRPPRLLDAGEQHSRPWPSLSSRRH